MKSNYYLVTYIIDGREVVSAIHWRDLAKFRSENEIISIVAQFRVGGVWHTVSNRKDRNERIRNRN